MASEWIEAVVDSGANAPVIGNRLDCKLGVCKSAREVRVKQGNVFGLEEMYLWNTHIKVINAGSQWVRFGLYDVVLDIGDRDCILGLPLLDEKGFSVHT